MSEFEVIDIVLLCCYSLLALCSIVALFQQSYLMVVSARKISCSILLFLICVLRISVQCVSMFSPNANSFSNRFLFDMPGVALFGLFSVYVSEMSTIVIVSTSAELKYPKLKMQVFIVLIVMNIVSILLEIALSIANSSVEIGASTFSRILIGKSCFINFFFASFFLYSGAFVIHTHITDSTTWEINRLALTSFQKSPMLNEVTSVYKQICGWSFICGACFTARFLVSLIVCVDTSYSWYLSVNRTTIPSEVLKLAFYFVGELIPLSMASSVLIFMHFDCSVYISMISVGSCIFNGLGHFLCSKTSSPDREATFDYSPYLNSALLDDSFHYDDKSINASDEKAVTTVSHVSNSRTFLESVDNSVVNQFVVDSGIRKFDPEDIRLGNRIGIGNFGEVFHGVLYSSTEVAVKRLFIPYQQQSQVFDRFTDEVTLLSKLSHPNIVQFMGIVRPPSLAIITEFMNLGSVHDMLYNADHDDDIHWDIILSILRDAARGMCYLHSLNPPIIHRDLKPANLLVNDSYHVKVTDFGIARVQNSTMTAIGTAAWIAPEIIRNAPYSLSADVYSFGILLWEICTRQVPYGYDTNPLQVIFKVISGARPDIPPPTPVPSCLVDLMQLCWAEEPTARPTFVTIYEILTAIQPDPTWAPYPELPNRKTKTKESTNANDGSYKKSLAKRSLPNSYTPSNTVFQGESPILSEQKDPLVNPLPPLILSNSSNF